LLQRKAALVGACKEKEIPVEDVLADLYEVLSEDDQSSGFNEMSLTELSAYIVRVHTVM
jgi:hypothetical protein